MQDRTEELKGRTSLYKQLREMHAKGLSDEGDVDDVIGKNISLIRHLRNMRAKGIADSLDISVQQYYNYESGKSVVSAKVLHDLARIFNVDINVFYTKTDD